MAIEIDFGKELGRLAFPPDVTDDQAQAYVRENYQTIRQGLLDRRRQELEAQTASEEAAKFRAGEYGLGERIGATVAELPKAFAQGIGETAKGFARVFEGGAPEIAVTPEEQQAMIARSPVTQFGEQLTEAGAAMPTLPGVEETLPAQIAGGVGSTLSIIPAGIVGGPAAAGVAYGLQAGESATKDAERAVNARIASALAAGDYDTAANLREDVEAIKNRAFIAAAPIGAVTEGALGVAGKMAGRLRTGRIGGIGERIAEAIVPKAPSFQRRFLGVTGAERVRGLAEGAITEGLQETAEQVGGNIAAASIYDPERGWMDGAANAGFIGAATGGLIGGVVGSKRNANLADAASEAFGGNPNNPLPRSSATRARPYRLTARVG